MPSCPYTTQDLFKWGHCERCGVDHLMIPLFKSSDEVIVIIDAFLGGFKQLKIDEQIIVGWTLLLPLSEHLVMLRTEEGKASSVKVFAEITRKKKVEFRDHIYRKHPEIAIHLLAKDCIVDTLKEKVWIRS
jgi:hypothetical protein